MRGLRFGYPVLLISPLIMVQLRLLMGRPAPNPSASVAAVVFALSLIDVVLAFVFERRLSREPMAGQMRAKGRDPRLVAALTGTTAMLTPACWALFATFVGLSLGLFVFLLPCHFLASHTGAGGIGA